MKIDRRFKRGENEFVTAQRAEKRFALQRSDEACFTRDDSRLRPAEKFVAAEADKIDATLEGLGRRRFVIAQAKSLRWHDRSAAEIFHKRNAFFAGELRDLSRTWRCDEPAHEEIAAMHFQNHRRIRANRGCI